MGCYKHGRAEWDDYTGCGACRWEARKTQEAQSRPAPSLRKMFDLFRKEREAEEQTAADAREAPKLREDTRWKRP